MSPVIRPALTLLGALSVLTGAVYPLVVTAVAQAVFPRQANGSLLEVGGRVVASELLGQPFADPAYFWGRPSATGPHPYNGAASTGSNLGPLNPSLHAAVAARIAALRAADPAVADTPVPIDLVTASASGLDPHISPAAALFQVSRVAAARRVQEETVLALVHAHVRGRVIGLVGEPTVHVLELNVALDAAAPRAADPAGAE